MPKTQRETLSRVKIYDRLARWVVTLGGAVVIVSVLGILVLIVLTALPLFYSAHAQLLAETALPKYVNAEGVLALGVHAAADDSSLVAYVADRSGKFRFIDLHNQAVIEEADAATGPVGDAAAKPKQTSRTLLGATPCGPETFTLRWSDGVVSLVRLNTTTTTPKFSLETVATLPPDKLGVPEQAIMYRTGEDEARSAALYGGQKIVVTRQTADLSGDKTETKIVLDPELPGAVTAIALSHDGKWLYAGTAGGSLLWWELGDDKWIDHNVAPPSRDKTPITSLALMLGDITLVAGDAAGNVTNWFFVNAVTDPPQQAGGGASKARPGGMVKEAKKLTYIRALEPQHAAIDAIIPSPRNRAC